MTPSGKQGKPAWLAKSSFENTAKRSEATKGLLSSLFDARAGKDSRESAPVPLDIVDVLELLVAPLRREPPAASQAAEAALTLAAFSMAEGRVLNLADPGAGDLENARIAGDRGAGDYLCNHILAPRNIPSTKGPLQSSSFRAGYLAQQVRDRAIQRYVEWQVAPGRSLKEVSELAAALVDEFLDKASAMPGMPEIAASRLTFIAYRQARERLLRRGSGGALEQYLLQGLLNQEMRQGQSGTRADTKNVGANDRAAGSGGDIEIRHGQKLLSSIEVSAADWDSKLSQLETAASANLSEATIAASGVAGDVSSDELAERLGPVTERLGLDVAVLDLHAFMDVVASRLTKHERAAAFRSVYDSIARWHRRQPELAHRLIDTLSSLSLIARG